MRQSGKRIYLLLGGLALAGQGWLWYFLVYGGPAESSLLACPTRRLIGIPCPACGTTRSAAALAQGQFELALQTNPLGYLALAFLIVIPMWIVYDLWQQTQSLKEAYQQAEAKLKRPQFAWPLALLLLANWIWNIFKLL